MTRVGYELRSPDTISCLNQQDKSYGYVAGLKGEGGSTRTLKAAERQCQSANTLERDTGCHGLQRVCRNKCSPLVLEELPEAMELPLWSVLPWGACG